MPQVLASALPDQPVLSTDGRELGTVTNLTMEPRTGELAAMLVDPNGNGFDGVETTDDGRLRIPAEAIRGFDDHVMVALPE